MVNWYIDPTWPDIGMSQISETKVLQDNPLVNRPIFTRDSYPMGSYWPMNHYLSTMEFKKEKKILFLSRAKDKGSVRFLDNEQEVFGEIEKLGREIGYNVEFVEMGYRNGPDTPKLFYSAAVVVGLHGGAFSNIVYCNPDAVVIEINNNNGRDCFAVLSKAKRIKYVRFTPKNEFLYQSYRGFQFTKKEIKMLRGTIELNLFDLNKKKPDCE